MGIERAATLYPRNNVTVDTGAGIDVRVLDDVNGGTDDISQTANAGHTNDNVERTFDPATGNVTNTNHAGTTLFKTGWALRLSEDMTPADDTNCNAYLPPGTLTVTVNVTLTHTGGTGYTGGTHTPTWRASLWRYNPSTDTGTLIAAGSNNGTSWQTAVIGNDEGTYKDVAISINVAASVEFAAGEVLLLQLGLNTGTLANPLSGTTTYTFAVRIDRNSTRIDWATGQNMMQVCTLASTATGRGIASESGKQATMARSSTGSGTATATKVGVLAKSFTLDGRGTVSRVLAVAEDFDLVGIGSPSISRALVAAKSFTLAGVGITARTLAVAEDFDLVGVGTPSFARVLVAAKSFTLDGRGTVSREGLLLAFLERTVAGRGDVTSAKATSAAKSFTLDGRGTATEARSVQAQRAFSLSGTGAISRVLAVAENFDLVGVGVAAFSRAVAAAKSFVLDGRGAVSREGLLLAFLERTVQGRGIVTEIHPVQAFRTFTVVGEGVVPVSGPGASTITLPLDELPSEGGSTTVVRRIVFLFED